MSKFVSLHNHTHFSILNALPSPKELFNRAKELNQEAIAVTDHGSLAASWDAFKLSKETSVKLLIGEDFNFINDVNNKNERIRRLVCIAKNQVGYRNLLTLSKKGFDNFSLFGGKVYPIIDWKLLEEHAEGMICLTGCSNGIIAQLINQRRNDEAVETLKRLMDIFGDNLGLEIQANNLSRPATPYNEKFSQQLTNFSLVKLGNEYNVKIVPTCHTHYLKKEDAEVHDVLLAIGAKQPVKSNNRKKLDVPDFYLKTEEEMKSFFKRNFGNEPIDEWIENTKYFAGLCEKPEWIAPSFTNPSGKELPFFPVKNEPDYEEFKKWLETQSDFIKKLDEDKSYLRYKCELVFVSKVPAGQEQIYRDRINEEFRVLEAKDVSSYMLLVADFLNWARKNDIMVNYGRGCVKGDTQVLTQNGFKEIKDINIGEFVYTHTGKLQQVLNKFEYDIHDNEKLLEIKSEYSFNKLILTKDHKVFVSLKDKDKKITRHTIYNRIRYGKPYKQHCYNDVYINSPPEWVEAKKIKKGDRIFTTLPNRVKKEIPKTLDVTSLYPDHIIDGEFFIEEHHLKNEMSSRRISKHTGIIFEYLRKLKINKAHIRFKDRDLIIDNYLSNFNHDINSWQKLKNIEYRKINRFIDLNEDFFYFLGRWVGDGCNHGGKKESGISISFNKSDIVGINKIDNYLKSLGFHTSHNPSSDSNGFTLTITSKLLFNIINFFIPNYKKHNDKSNKSSKTHSNTKHLPIGFRNLETNLALSLLYGLVDSDGTEKENFYIIKSISKELILHVKELLLYLGINSSVCIDKNPKRYGVKTNTSYTIRFNKNFVNKKISFNPNGYFAKITEILEVKLDKVYDIMVDKDHSYLTTNGVIHNSVGGSLVGYLLDIHKADSIKYGLIFERFYNMEKESGKADVDSDIEANSRENVLKYLINKYGADSTSMIANFNKITPKVYARDLARSCEFGGDRKKAVEIGNRIADIIPKETKKAKELEENALYTEYGKVYNKLISCSAIINTIRNTSQHAGGFLANRRPIVGLVPLKRDKDGILCIEYEKENTEDSGMVKIDILGLSTLDIIKQTIKIINKTNKLFSIDDIKYNEYDQKTYDLISSGNTTCIFQLGTSAATIDLCKKLQPKSIEDLAVITTLARPASKDIRQIYIETKNGERQFTLVHDSLKRAFEKTLGFCLFDESLLIVAKDVANWSLSEADKLRKMTKDKGKYPARDAKIREDFIEGAIKNSIEKKMATKIWDDIVGKMSLYIFNKSHSVLYSFTSFTTAYLKAHYPVEFLLANLIFESHSAALNAEANKNQIKHELRQYVKISSPDINKSNTEYEIENNVLITGFKGIKYVGDDGILDILEKRPFHNFHDFMSRVDSSKVRANTIQALAATGALDSFNMSRRAMFLYCSDYRKKLQTNLKKKKPTEFSYPWPQEEDWTLPEKYALEKHYLGEAFICGKRDAYNNFFKDTKSSFIKDIINLPEKSTIPCIKGEIKNYFEFPVKKPDSKYLGRMMAKVTIEDINNDICKVTIFPDKLDIVKTKLKDFYRNKIQLQPGTAISFMASVNYYEDEFSLVLDNLYECIPEPPLPKDMKIKKVALKQEEVKEKSSDINNNEQDEILPENLFEDIEDELFEEGLLDLEID